MPQSESHRPYPILGVEDDGDQLLHSNVMDMLRRDLGIYFNYDDLGPVWSSPDLHQREKRENARSKDIDQFASLRDSGLF